MEKTAFLFACLVSMSIHAQMKSILVFDLVNQTLDSITDVSYDSTILSEHTVYNTGDCNSAMALLTNIPPTSNLYAGSQFSRKQRANSAFDLTDFPIRTSVKIFQAANDVLYDLCSGSLISKKHIITAAHCVSNLNTNELLFDSLFVSPIFNDGKFNTSFPSSHVTKIYFLKDWSLNGEDMAILELGEPIGKATGWISIGFNTNDEELKEGIYYKFSYPATTNLMIDSNEYNGDSLYYNYGLIDNISEHRISINNASGNGGESGSSIIRIENGEQYITYGVLSFTNNLSHSRINNWRYYAIKSIIKDDLEMVTSDTPDNFLVYPIPASNILNIKRTQKIEVLKLILFDNMSRICLVEDKPESCVQLDISSLPSGMYYLHILTPESTISKKVIKNFD